MLPLCSLSAPLLRPFALSLKFLKSALYSFSQPKTTIPNLKFSIYSFPELRSTRDLLLTHAWPLCSCAEARFVHMLPLCLLMLPRRSLVHSSAPFCSLVAFSCFPHCSSVLPRYSFVLPLSHFLFSRRSHRAIEFLQV